MAEKKAPKKPVKTGAKKVKAGAKQVKADAKKRVTFTFHAPDAGQVCVAGTFNGWDPRARVLKRNTAGVWSAVITLAPGVYEYRYVIDGNWVDDPAAQERCPNEHGSENCVRRV